MSLRAEASDSGQPIQSDAQRGNIVLNQPRTYLIGQTAPRSADYICNMCGTRQAFRQNDTFGPCRVCDKHANAWTSTEDIDPQQSNGKE